MTMHGYWHLALIAGLAAAVGFALPAAAEQTTADYSCEGRIKLHVVFDSDASTATVSGGDLGTLTMQAVPSGDGFHYKSGKYQLRGRGNQAAWQVGMNDPFPCIAE
jgi:membrane-bound inhibitor of C-type lysozyme